MLRRYSKPIKVETNEMKIESLVIYKYVNKTKNKQQQKKQTKRELLNNW